MYIADLHIHSNYSRATSRDCTPEHLDLWARRKGIHIVGTGDFTHPAWRQELNDKLEPAEDGLYVLKKEYRIKDAAAETDFTPRFVITGEISSIYKKNDRVRKVHSLILLPGLEDAEIISRKLENIGNIHSDGRPILGLDCRDLLEIVLELCPRAIYVPAHIWTPHFSLFGAFSGFDTVEECFEDLTPQIHAMETGLSSDPPMNWRISALDKYHLISNSDAHSPAKLGREANLLDIEMSYDGLYGAIQEGKGLAGTLEFFPEEGKYHYDGHRKCHLCLSPLEAEKYQGKCPVCGRKLTIGVSHRVEQLSDRSEGYIRENARPFENIVPLPEVIAACTGHSAVSASVSRQYTELLCSLGTEFEILRRVPVEDIKKSAGYLVAEGIRRLRGGLVTRLPGFDGEYGTIRLFEPNELSNTTGQMSFFDCYGMELGAPLTPEMPDVAPAPDVSALAAADLRAEDYAVVAEDFAVEDCVAAAANPGLNPRQQQAVCAVDRTVAVIAGPGTGKTKTLISRIMYLLENRKVKPSEMTAVTFTNKAAAEMKERLQKQLGKKQTAQRIQIGTFHSICLNFLKAQKVEFILADSMETLEIAEDIVKSYALPMTPKQFLQTVSRIKTSGNDQNFRDVSTGSHRADLKNTACDNMDEKCMQAVDAYGDILRRQHIFDFDDLLLETIKLLNDTKDGENSGLFQSFRYLLVDEFQDISPVQYALIKTWNRHGRELFVIGDPDQSIYGFRGADAGCFLRLQTDFPDTCVIRLEVNYRSTPPVVDAACVVISKNPGEQRNLFAHQTAGRPIRLVSARSEMAEAIFVAKEINRQIGGIDMLDAQEKAGGPDGHKARSFADIAVLYRTHRQADLLEVCLKKEGIPYVVAGRDDFLMETSVRGTVAFFHGLENPEDTLARASALKLLWGLEPDALSDSVFEAMADTFLPLLKKTRPQKVLERWMAEMNLGTDAAMRKLQSMAVFYKTMAEFLSALSLGVEGDLYRCGGKQYTADAVTLMTLHGSKGLEFPVTVLYGVRDGTIPFESEKHPADPQEERRLFYVGMTRAREELILTTSGEPSPFLADLPEAACLKEQAGKSGNRDAGEQLSLFDFM